MAVKKKEKRKLIDVPLSALKVLSKMATDERMAVKTYIEKILIDYAEKNKNVLNG